jgi:DNA-binding CsgD family transcriptional regulator/tetratricopeptide (TPR) repeat protein
MYDAVAWVQTEMDNIQQFWAWAVEDGAWWALDSTWETLWMYYSATSFFVEGEVLFARTPANALDGASRTTLALLLSAGAWCSFRLGKLEVARRHLDQAARLLHNVHNLHALTVYHLVFAFVLNALGDYSAAADHGLRGLRAAQADGQWNFIANTHFALGRIAASVNDAEAANRHFSMCVHLVKQAHFRWGVAYTYNELGLIERAGGHVETAQHFFQHSLPLFREIDDHWGTATALLNLGATRIAGGERSAGAAMLYEALDLALSVGIQPVVVDTLVEFAPLLHPLRAFELLSTLAAQPDMFRAVRTRVDSEMDRLCAVLSPQAIHRARARAVTSTVGSWIDELRRLQPTLVETALVEPLSPRETELLRLVADGARNRAIATALNLSPNTVKWHLRNIFGKLGVSTRLQAVRRARELHLLD